MKNDNDNDNASDNAVTNEMWGLGETPDAVADSLRKTGVRGYRGCCFSCPLARYLKARGFGFVTVGVNSVVCVVPKETTKHRLPAAVLEFVKRFDDGLYPDLREGDMEGESE